MTISSLVPALGAAALALSTQVHAQQLTLPNELRSVTESTRAAYGDDRQPYYEARRGAYDNGYREGLREGEQDGRRHSAYRYQDNRTWQRADKGYNRSFGDIDRYRQQFRAGFGEGYQAGYARYGQGNGSYGRAVPRQVPYDYGNVYPDRRSAGPYYGGAPGPYGSAGYVYGPAYTNGLNDGLEKGREDGRKRRSFDPSRHDWYRKADRHYRGEYGPKPQYATIYRDGFNEGYNRGYREFGYVR